MSIQDSANALREEFAFLDDWEDRYAHIIDMGKANPALDPDERTDESRVRGCASQVWMVTEQAEDDTLIIRAESDAVLVSGLIAILVRLFSGQTAEEIIHFDARRFFNEIGVSDTLTAQRSNGLAAMLKRIKEEAHTVYG